MIGRISSLCILFLLFSGMIAGAESLSSLQSRNGDFLLELKSVNLVNAPSQAKEAIPSAQALSFQFEIMNSSQIRKVDGIGKFGYRLSDEFANQYQVLAPPIPDSPATSDSKELSLYPGERLKETVYFEPPVEKSKLLILEIMAEGVNSDKPFRLEIPQSIFRVSIVTEEKLTTASDNHLVIAFPPDGGLVRAGEDVTIRIKVASGLNLPETIFIMSPHDTFEDTTKALQYNIHIPPTQPPGPFPVIVLARWGAEEMGKVISKTVTLQVMDLSKSLTTQ